MSEAKRHIVTVFVDEKGKGIVSLDGVELNTTRVQFDSRAQKPTEVTLTIHAAVQVAAVVNSDNLKAEQVVMSDWGRS